MGLNKWDKATQHLRDAWDRDHRYSITEGDAQNYVEGYGLRTLCLKYDWDEARFIEWKLEPFEYDEASMWLTLLTPGCSSFRDHGSRRYCARTGKSLPPVCAECGTCKSYHE